MHAGLQTVASAYASLKKPLESVAVHEGSHEAVHRSMASLGEQNQACTQVFAEYLSNEVLEQGTESQQMVKSVNRCLGVREAAIVQYGQAVAKANASKTQLAKQSATPRTAHTGLLSKAKAIVKDDHDTKIKKLQDRIESEERFVNTCKQHVDRITVQYVDELARTSVWIRQVCRVWGIGVALGLGGWLFVFCSACDWLTICLTELDVIRMVVGLCLVDCCCCWE
jgi:hypothetical protein